jgi:hypothetical protein
MAELRDPEVWENGGNVVSFEQKRREAIERQEEELVDYNLSGYAASPLTVLCCPCGCDALVAYSDGGSVFAQCIDCGNPMGWSLLTFMSGQD